jgi:hypothetical protein
MNDKTVTKLEAKYREWIALNPHVPKLFESYTLIAISRGAKRLSAWLVVNRLRWEVEFETKGTDIYDSKFKISNDYIAYLARDFMAKYPEHNGLFKTKEMYR